MFQELGRIATHWALGSFVVALMGLAAFAPVARGQDCGWGPLGSGMNDNVYALTVYDNDWIRVTGRPWDLTNWAPGEPHDHMGIPQSYSAMWGPASGHPQDMWNDADDSPLVNAFVVEYGQVRYVDDDAPLGGDGSSWETAFKFLQDALAVALAGDEIHVAQGTHRPDRDAANPNGTGARTATFQFRNGVALHGGYAGLGAADPDLRDIALYETILSADLLGDDEPGFGNNVENCYHVLTVRRRSHLDSGG